MNNITTEEYDAFKNDIKRYLVTDEKIIYFKKLALELKEDKQGLEKEIMDFMKNNNVNEVVNSANKFEARTVYRRKPVTRKMIKGHCLKICNGNEDKQKQFYQFLFNSNNLPGVEKTTLKKIDLTK